ncbi:MAG: YeeE/YedE family protein [Gemmatimonadetes bacterium]|nr:YeeE/YedE family protein [Gemmatimonadota bacterium]
MLDALRSPWPWWVAGPLIGLVVLFVFWYGGRKWGVSQSLQHICAATLPRGIEYFRYDWRKDGSWNLAMVAGVVLGGFIGGRVLSGPDDVVAISEATRADLIGFGITDFTGLVPSDLFSFQALLTPTGVALVIGGGFLVGFGARWANGCTSGHAISGLATLQPSSLLAVIGFFLGGLISAHFLLPLLF